MKLPLCILSSLLSVSLAKAAEPRLTGTFVQLQTWMSGISSEKWKQEMDAMRTAGIDTVILQWLQYDSTRYYPVNVSGGDPTEEILSYADKNGMKVYVGLLFDSRWWTQWDDSYFLKTLAKRNAKFAKKVWDRYGKHSSFAGWYLPFEVFDSDYDKDSVVQLRNFLRYMARACRKVDGRKNLPVTTSVYFHANFSPSDTEEILSRIFKGSEIDIIMVQDGVGANNWSDQIEDSVAAYLKAYASVAHKAGAEMWTIIESFDTLRDEAGKDKGRVAADMARMKRQIQSAQSLSDRLVTFDFFHYMSPHRGKAQKKLFEDYIDWLN